MLADLMFALIYVAVLMVDDYRACARFSRACAPPAILALLFYFVWIVLSSRGAGDPAPATSGI